MSNTDTSLSVIWAPLHLSTNLSFAAVKVNISQTPEEAKPFL